MRLTIALKALTRLIECSREASYETEVAGKALMRLGVAEKTLIEIECSRECSYETGQSGVASKELV